MELPNYYYSITLILASWFLFSHVSAFKSVYIVHMDKSLMPRAFSSHHHWYSSLLTSVQSLDQTTSDSDRRLHQNLIYVYDNAFHGFSSLLSEQEVEALKRSPGFISAYADTTVPAPDTTRSIDFLSLSSAVGIWPAAEYGKDVIVGVLDTGIWPESPSFKDDEMGAIPAKWKGICQEGEEFNSSMCNKKLIGARYFNQGIRAGNPGITIPMNSARDIDGHGTHVASTAAGSFVEGVTYFGYATGTARGIAPRARLAAYKVLWDVGGGGGADILAGIDQAVADGVDILSISLTTGPENFNLYENPLSIASFGAREKGVLVCLSGGNRGPSVRTIREKGIPWGLVVAAGTMDRWFSGTLTLGNGKSFTGWTLFPGTASVSNVPVIYNETLATCDSILAELTQQGMIICNLSLETANFDTMMHYLPASNAQGAIFIGDVPSIYESGIFPYPGTVIGPADGQQVVDYVLNNAAPRAKIQFQQTITGEGPRPAPAVADFSSRGPARSYEGILKPDILAPGVLILAASSPSGTELNYTMISGTSMACPHISGVAALLKAAHPDWSPSAIQSAIMTTANPLNNAKQPIRELNGDLAIPLSIGSGHVDPNRALDPGLVYDNTPQDFVNLICSLNYTSQQIRTIIRSSYNCSAPSSDLNYPSFVAVFQPPDVGTWTRRFQRTVTNVGNGAATYSVRVVAPSNTTVSVTPQTLVFKNKYEKLMYTLSITFVADLEVQHRPGSITWIDESGKYSVRSPILVSAGADFFE